MFCFCFLYIFNDSCQTDYLKVYRTDLRRIFTVGGTVAVDDQSEISCFRSLEGRCDGNQFLLVPLAGG